MRLTFLAMALALGIAPNITWAAGGDGGGGSGEPPEETQTSKDCKKSEIWDEKAKKCAPAQESRFDDDTRYRAVRELAWAGQPERALTVLATMTEGDTDRVLTYKGFAHRKAGRMKTGLKFYALALAQNPDNILARSYLGQAYVQLGKLDLAREQLVQIRARNGDGGWAEASLARAIDSGQGSDY